MYLFIGGVDRTANLINNSISITDELQERINAADFTLADFSPSYFDDVKIYDGYPIISSTATSITLKRQYDSFLKAGETIVVDIGGNEQSGVITSTQSNNGFLQLNFTAIGSPTGIAGKLKFAGNIVNIQDSNSTVLSNILFSIKALDYTRIFDRKTINDTFESRDARYIINDFCNTTINKNQEIDGFEYANTTALRTIWSGTPTVTTEHREGDKSMEYTGTGTLVTVGTFTPIDITLGQVPTFGNITDEFGNNITDEFGNIIQYAIYSVGRIAFWYNCTNVSSISVRFGSDSSNYHEYTLTPTLGDWVYFDVKVSDMTQVGSPVYTAITYARFSIVSIGTSTTKIDGIRILEKEFFRHYPYVQTSNDFYNFKVSRVKPTETMQRIADSLAWYWYVDYNKYIWLFPNTTIPAPITITESSDNFSNLSISFDTSRLINRQVVRGGEETSTSKYSQIVEGNSVAREWITKNKFKNLIVKLNDGTITDTCEATTTTTFVKATAHGLIPGDYIVNRTRANAVREVLTVLADSFTVSVVTGQTSGDSFSLFVFKDVGVEGLDIDTSFNYMSNFNEKSIRSSSTEATLIGGQFLLFDYNEVIPILVQRTDNVSVGLMKSVLGYTDGIFDGQPIVDQTITSRSEAIKTAEAMINKYSNVVITATFTTNEEGLEAGQLIRIKDTTSSLRNIDQDFVIQSVRLKQIAWGYNQYSVTCSSLLFGMLELLQQLLANNRKIKVNEDEVINNIEDANETITISDTAVGLIDGITNTETLTLSEIVTTDIILPPFKYGPSGTKLARYNLCCYG